MNIPFLCLLAISTTLFNVAPVFSQSPAKKAAPLAVRKATSSVTGR